MAVFAQDYSFQPPFRPPGTGTIDQVIPISKGRYIIAHGFRESAEGDEGDGFVTYTRVFADGSPDKTFGRKGSLTFDDDIVTPTFTNGRLVLIYGQESSVTATLAIYTINGKPDESVGNGSGSVSIPFKQPTEGGWSIDTVDLQHTYADGSMLISVQLDNDNDPSGDNCELLKLSADGTLDQSFGSQGIVVLPNGPGEIGQILVADEGIYAYLFPNVGDPSVPESLVRLTPQWRQSTRRLGTRDRSASPLLMTNSRNPRTGRSFSWS